MYVLFNSAIFSCNFIFKHSFHVLYTQYTILFSGCQHYFVFIFIYFCVDDVFFVLYYMNILKEGGHIMNQRIKEIRSKLNLSQREFGEKLGVSRDVISNIEYGRVEPKKVFIQLLCTTYNVNEDWLLTGQGEMLLKTSSDEKNISEALNIFKELSPELQDYALKQIKGLLELQSIQSPNP